MVFVGIIRYIMNQPLPFIEILGHNITLRLPLVEKDGTTKVRSLPSRVLLQLQTHL